MLVMMMTRRVLLVSGTRWLGGKWRNGKAVNHFCEDVSSTFCLWKGSGEEIGASRRDPQASQSESFLESAPPTQCSFPFVSAGVSLLQDKSSSVMARLLPLFTLIPCLWQEGHVLFCLFIVLFSSASQGLDWWSAQPAIIKERGLYICKWYLCHLSCSSLDLM
jgi:hypothetical protein